MKHWQPDSRAGTSAARHPDASSSIIHLCTQSVRQVNIIETISHKHKSTVRCLVSLPMFALYKHKYDILVCLLQVRNVGRVVNIDLHEGVLGIQQDRNINLYDSCQTWLIPWFLHRFSLDKAPQRVSLILKRGETVPTVPATRRMSSPLQSTPRFWLSTWKIQKMSDNVMRIVLLVLSFSSSPLVWTPLFRMLGMHSGIHLDIS